MGDLLGGSGGNVSIQQLLPLIAYMQSSPQGQGGFLGGQNLQSLIALMLLMQRLNPGGTTGTGSGTRPTLTGISPKSTAGGANVNYPINVTGGSFSPDVELVLFGSGCPEPAGCGYKRIGDTQTSTGFSVNISQSGHLVAPGDYEVRVRNGPSGSISNEFLNLGWGKDPKTGIAPAPFASISPKTPPVLSETAGDLTGLVKQATLQQLFR